jgi:hypothetical protein
VNCYQLRRHLAAGHHIDLRGMAYDQLAAIHAHEHRAVQGHYHDDPERGDG